MNKKNNVKKTAALLLGIALTVGATGCDFIVTDNAADLAQVVATVDISTGLKKDKDYKEVANDVQKVIKELSTDIQKRDLVAYFLSTGYQYVESYGYTYEATFNMLMDGLVSREIMIQYAIAYYLKNNSSLKADECCGTYIDAQLAAVEAETNGKEKKALLEKHKEVLVLKYFLTDGGTDAEDYDRAVYTLKKSLNDSLDSLETQYYIKADDEEHNHEEARTLPTGVETEREDYYAKPAENYNVYTGRNTLDSCGSYEKVDGSTTSSRQKAYNAFLANLQGYNMIGDEENTSNVELLDYYYVELASILGQSLITKYFETLEDEVANKLNENGGEYVQRKYDELLAEQQEKYAESYSAFDTAMDSVSDTSFLLYGLEKFGYVYNILLPFSTEQNIEYTEAKNNSTYSQDALFNVRKKILNGVEGKDLRGSWISEHDHANYSYAEGEGAEKKYYFFEGQTAKSSNDKYEALKQYAGSYAYNGTVDEENDWKATPAPVGINKFIKIFNDHINAVVGKDVAVKFATENDVTEKVNGAYDLDSEATEYTDKVTDKVDYSKFVYYSEELTLDTTDWAANYFNKESDIYKAVSAVNELMFAYSTDTGCLNTYLGYAVSPYGTDFVKEFEYAAQKAVEGGVGTYVVCATDYGWHIVFASYVFDNAEVYGGYKAAEAEIEGTFSNLFYESLKTSAIENYSTEKQNKVLNGYDNEGNVTRFKDAYKDLIELDNQ